MIGHGAASSEQGGQMALALPVRRPRRDDARRAQDLADFEALVAVEGGATARALCAQRSDWDERYIREMAEHSQLVLSFPGSRGYKLIAAADADEIAHAENAIGAQVEKMQAKRVRLHNILGLRRAAARLGDQPVPDLARGLSAECFSAGGCE